MNFLLDTNILIYALQRQAGAAFHDFLFQLSARGLVFISVINRFELLAGTTENNQKKNVAFLDTFPLLAVTKEMAARAEGFFREFRKEGVTLDNEDWLLAATALEEGLAVVTTNARHFPSFTVKEKHIITFIARRGQTETKEIFILAA